MGFVDWISGAFNTIKDTVSNFGNDIKDGIGKAIDTVKSTASEGWKAAKSVVSEGWKATKEIAPQLYADAKGVINWAGERIAKAQDTASNVLSSPFTLIAIAAGGIAALILATKL